MAPTFNAIGLSVADLEKSLSFYRRLGLEPGPVTGPHAEAALPGGLRLMWDEHKDRQDGKGKINLAFACTDAAEVDSTHKSLVEAGYRSEQEPWDAPWGQRYAVILDPDGNGVDLYY
jgi:catechol 2,3-dioxygenase-like lactoylglutathione lyase family enzyme